MTVEYLYKLADFISMKETNGNIMNIDEFNIYMAGKYPEFVKEQIEMHERYQKDPTATPSVLSSKYLNGLLSNSNVTISAGSGPLPGTYNYWKSANGQYNSVYKTVDLVTEEEKDSRISSSTGRRPERYPCAIIRGSTIYVWPKTINPLNLTFYIDVVTPLLDYYIDADDNEIFMAAGATGVSVPAGGTSSAGVSGPTTVNSNTVELDIPSDSHPEFLNYILGALGIRIGVEGVTQYAELQQQKQQAL